MIQVQMSYTSRVHARMKERVATKLANDYILQCCLWFYIIRFSFSKKAIKEQKFSFS